MGIHTFSKKLTKKNVIPTNGRNLRIAVIMASKNYVVYILSSISRVLYIGVTNNLQRRVLEHKGEKVQGFTKKYKGRSWFILK